jgi:hypothetical protein
VNEIGETVLRARSTARNLFNKYRARSKRWNKIELLGWFEIDALSEDDMPLLGSDRAELLSLIHAQPHGNAPVYIPTIHGIVSLNGLDYQQFRDALQEKWPHKNQVDVQPFYETAPMEKSIYSVIRYSLKRTCSTFLRGVDEPWPDSWLVEFESWHYQWSRGFQSMKLSIGKRKENAIMDYKAIRIVNDFHELEPMPITMSF